MVVDVGNRHYSLGPAVMRLSLAVTSRTSDLIAVSGPTLDRIRGLTGETVSLQTTLGEERVCIAELVSPEPIRMESGVGHVPPVCGRGRKGAPRVGSSACRAAPRSSAPRRTEHDRDSRGA